MGGESRRMRRNYLRNLVRRVHASGGVVEKRL